jgi:uncharacterized coiled-coil DUF342 family protein
MRGITLFIVIAIAVIASVVAYRNAASLGDVQGQLALKAKVAALGDQVKTIQSRQSDLQSSVDAETKQTAVLDTELSKLQVVTDNLTKQLQNTLVERDNATAKLNELTAQYRQLAAQVQEWAAKTAASDVLNAKSAMSEGGLLKAQVADLSKQLSDMTNDRDQFKAKSTDSSTQVADLTQQLSVALRERDQLKAKVATLGDQVKTTQTKQSDLQSKVDVETKQIEALNTERNKLQVATDNLTKQLQNTLVERDDATAKLNELTAQFQSLRDDRDQLKSKLSATSDQLKMAASTADASKSKIAALTERLKGAMANEETLRSGLADATKQLQSAIVTGQATAAVPTARGKTLDPNDIPMVSSFTRNRVREAYLTAPDHKALALSALGDIGMAVGLRSDELARTAALTFCNSLHRGPCDIYAVGNVVIWTFSAPPIPQGPLVRTVLGPMVPFDPDKVPLLGKNVHDFLKENYTSPVLRALAMGPTGGWSYTGDENEEMSARRALQTCGFSEHTPCMIVAMGDRFTVGIPATVEVTGWLQLGYLQVLSDEDKTAIAKQYTLAPDWRALAVANNGKYGIAAQETSEVAAISAALLACKSAGGVGCAIFAVGPYRVKTRVDHPVP